MSSLIETIHPIPDKDKVFIGKVLKTSGRRYTVNIGGRKTEVESHVGKLRCNEIVSISSIGSTLSAIGSKGVAGITRSQWIQEKDGYDRVDISAPDQNNVKVSSSSERIFYVKGLGNG